jgi:transcriptional regulator of acetoin/glycerol metabolism
MFNLASNRVVAATHGHFEEMILNGNYCNDLYYGLDVFPIFIRRYASGPKIFLSCLPHARWPGPRLV